MGNRKALTLLFYCTCVLLIPMLHYYINFLFWRCKHRQHINRGRQQLCWLFLGETSTVDSIVSWSNARPLTNRLVALFCWKQFSVMHNETCTGVVSLINPVVHPENLTELCSLYTIPSIHLWQKGVRMKIIKCFDFHYIILLLIFILGFLQHFQIFKFV